MNCFRHPQVVAVGICKACNKALCFDCSADLGWALVCRGDCEQRAKSVGDPYERAAKEMSASASAATRYGLMVFIIAIVFFAMGVEFFRTFSNHQGLGNLGYCFLTLGVVFMLWGVSSLKRRAQYTKLGSKA